MTDMIGDELRENLLHPQLGNWNISSWMMGEWCQWKKIMFGCTKI